MKISKARIKQIINEELFYREFYREGEKLKEVYSEKQRRWSCAQMNKPESEMPEGLTKAQATEMCKSKK